MAYEEEQNIDYILNQLAKRFSAMQVGQTSITGDELIKPVIALLNNCPRPTDAIIITNQNQLAGVLKDLQGAQQNTSQAQVGLATLDFTIIQGVVQDFFDLYLNYVNYNTTGLKKRSKKKEVKKTEPVTQGVKPKGAK